MVSGSKVLRMIEALPDWNEVRRVLARTGEIVRQCGSQRGENQEGTPVRVKWPRANAAMHSRLPQRVRIGRAGRKLACPVFAQ
jgi:hypothetical protein